MEKERKDCVSVMHGCVIITMDGEQRVFRDGGIVIEEDKIKAIGQSKDIIDEFGDVADEVIDLSGHILLPGLINTHVHTSQQLARGIADDVDLITWLHHRIWPYESNMTEHDSYLSTLLCGIELIHSGVTCLAEAGGQHVSGMASAVNLLGLRACLTQSTMDSGHGLPSSWAALSTHDCIQVRVRVMLCYSNSIHTIALLSHTHTPCSLKRTIITNSTIQHKVASESGLESDRS